jgi:hypothetical protein
MRKEAWMRLSSLTLLGFEVNAVWDGCPDFDFTLDQIHEAARAGKLASTLAARFGDAADLSLLLGDEEELGEVEVALRDAACADEMTRSPTRRTRRT